MLPTVPWDVDPVFLSIPREFMVGGLGVLAGLSVLYGLVKRSTDQLVSGVFFAVLAAIVGAFLKDQVEIRYYSLLFVFVFLGGHALLKWQIKRAGGPAADANDFIVYGVLGVLVGARLGHVLFYDLDKALEDPAWVFKIWTGGLASHGAVLGLITAMWIFTKRRGIPFLEGADRFSFSAALGATLVRLGNLLNSEIVGKKTDGTWGFQFFRHDDERPPPLRHPSQIYEIVLGLTVLALLYVIDRKLGREKRPRGALISAFFAIYFTGRLFIEFFKEFEPISMAETGVRMGQILSLPGILLGFYGIYWSMKRRLPAEWPGAEPPADAPDEDEDDEEDAEDDSAADEETEAGDEPDDAPDETDQSGTRDADIDDEFDAGGRLKREREKDD